MVTMGAITKRKFHINDVRCTKLLGQNMIEYFYEKLSKYNRIEMSNTEIV